MPTDGECEWTADTQTKLHFNLAWLPGSEKLKLKEIDLLTHKSGTPTKEKL